MGYEIFTPLWGFRGGQRRGAGHVSTGRENNFRWFPFEVTTSNFKRKNMTVNRIKYLALLRGINVGGNNIIKMEDLRKLFEEADFSDVTTYIQSGNVIFNDTENDKMKLSVKTGEILRRKLGNEIKTALLTLPEMKRVIDGRPEGFGDEKDRYKYDIIFIIAPLKAGDAIKEIRTRTGVDEVYEGDSVIYIRRLTNELTKSYFSKTAETAIYRSITIRNWNTTKKLYELMTLSGNK
jgi:uncharacterized protein (DUF1697 family)